MIGRRSTLSVRPSRFIKLLRFSFRPVTAPSTDECFKLEAGSPSVASTEGAVFPRFESLRGGASTAAAAAAMSGVRCPSVGVVGAEDGLMLFARSSELPEKSRRMPAAGLLSVRLRGGMVDATALSGRWTADVDCERGEGLGMRPFRRVALDVLPPWVCDWNDKNKL